MIARSITIKGVCVKFYSRANHFYCRVIEGDSSVLVAASVDRDVVLSAYERQLMALRGSV